MSEHTPGPWLYREPEDDELHEIYSESGGDLICYPVWTYNQRANIPLIAAAPDLLAALKAHIPWKNAGLPEKPPQGWGIWQNAIDAINKAEGRSDG
jgi:hypothetical protein